MIKGKNIENKEFGCHIEVLYRFRIFIFYFIAFLNQTFVFLNKNLLQREAKEASHSLGYFYLLEIYEFIKNKFSFLHKTTFFTSLVNHMLIYHA